MDPEWQIKSSLVYYLFIRNSFILMHNSYVSKPDLILCTFIIQNKILFYLFKFTPLFESNKLEIKQSKCTCKSLSKVSVFNLRSISPWDGLVQVYIFFFYIMSVSTCKYQNTTGYEWIKIYYSSSVAHWTWFEIFFQLVYMTDFENNTRDSFTGKYLNSKFHMLSRSTI